MRHDDQGKRGRPERVHNGPLGDLYHVLLTASWPRLVLIVAACYVVGNSLFALGYLLDPGGIAHARKLIAHGESPTQVAQLLGVARSTLYAAL